MRINKAGEHYSNLKYSFKSLRTDKNTVSVLKNGTNPINGNQRLNILASLKNLSERPDKDNIEFLLDVADNLVYGQATNSKFRKILDETGNAPAERENTDWSKILQETILQALNDTEQEDVTSLQAKYTRVFETPKDLTQEEKALLSQRNVLNAQIHRKTEIENEDDIIRSARIRKNIDYFVSSSEISLSQKKDCLDKFIYLLSDDYQINPQLENRKLQVVDEMLNDMLIKTPEDDVLTIKEVDQRITGICAAISICRKAVAYEDKSRYMDIVLEELKDSNTMEVFDITDLGSGKKINLQKADIDYDSALAKGYRIVDASAHLWMQNAHASGNGTILTEAYTAFDDDTYNVFDDASWYEGLEDKYYPAKQLLKALIKEKEYIKAVDKRRKNYKEINKTIIDTKDKLLNEQAKIMGALASSLGEVFADSDANLTILSKKLIKFYTGSSDKNEVNVSPKLPTEVRQQIIVDYLKEQVGTLTPEQEDKLNKNSKKILDLTSAYVDVDNQINKAKNFNTNKSKYRYYRNLFQAAAAHRLAVEADVNMPDGIVRYEKTCNLPPKEVRVFDYMKDLRNSFNSQQVRARFKNLDGVVPTKSHLDAEIVKDMVALETTIPQTVNMVINNLFGKRFSDLLSETADAYVNIINTGDKETLSRFADVFQVEKDKKVVVAELNKLSDNLSNSPSNEDVQESVRILGFEDSLSAATLYVSTFYNSLRSGISEEEYNQLVARFGAENISSALETNRLQFQSVLDSHQDIMEKWAVPSTRTLIIDRIEKAKNIISRQKLDKLKVKFDRISAQLLENDKIENLKDRRKANEEVCVFAPEELEIFEQIEKQLPQMRKYSKNTYKDVNTYLFDVLEKQYSYIGMLNGQFWIREEGSSGLSSNEQIRIIEQMTGKPYHIESDVRDAAKQIKEGNGSGILSTSVDDTDYAFHAQYIPFVTSETFIDPITKKKVIEDVLWTDNSWGKVEKESFWDGKDGHKYTDYDRGYGWKSGFIVDDSLRIGQKVSDMHCAVGRAGKNNDTFGLFGDIVLPGTPVDTYQKLYKVFGNILAMDEVEEFYKNLEDSIVSGHKLDVDFLVGIDDLAQAYISKLEKRLEKEIKTEEDFNKLPDNDPLKLEFEKIALYFATVNPQLRDSVCAISSIEEIEQTKKGMFDEHVDTFLSILGKSNTNIEQLYLYTSKEFKKLFEDLKKQYSVDFSQEQKDELSNIIFFDQEEIKNFDGSIRSLENYFASRVEKAAETIKSNKKAAAYFEKQAKAIILKGIDENIRIKSLDSPIITNSPLAKEFIASLDKYLKPVDDDELLLLIQGLQETGYENTDIVISALTMEDVGLNFKPAVDYVKKYKADDLDVIRAISEVAGTGYIYSQLPSEDESPENFYRSLHVKLADMDVQKFVKNFKAEAFAKYKVRQAFPQPVVFSDEDIIDSVHRTTDAMEELVTSIKGNYYILDLLDKKTKFAEKYSDSELYNSLLNGENVNIEENSEELETFLQDLKIISDLVGIDASLNNLYSSYEEIISVITNSKGNINGKLVAPYFAKINTIYAEWDTTANETKFLQNIKEEKARLKSYISTFIDATFEPKYKDEAYAKMNQFVKLLIKNPSSPDVDYILEDFCSFVVAKHITKNPTALLRETVKLLQEGKKDTETYSILKTYLLSTLKVAQQTKIQYKLVQNQHEGISSKTKEMLPMFCVKMPDGTTQPMGSSAGMLYLIEKLKNHEDNNVILNLFLEQSGLTEDALNALIENFQVENTKDLVDENEKIIIDSIKELSYIRDALTDYFEKSAIRYKSFDDAFVQINNYVKRKTRHISNSPMVKGFVDYMTQVQVKETTIPPNSQMFMNVLSQIINSAFESLSQNINYKIEFLNEIPKLLEDRASLIYAIKVPNDSQAAKQRDEFAKKYEVVMQYVNQVINNVYQEVAKIENDVVGQDQL